MSTNTANNGQVQAILVVMTLKSLSLRHHTRVPRPQIKQTSSNVTYWRSLMSENDRGLLHKVKGLIAAEATFKAFYCRVDYTVIPM